jgi:hypothetical protein
MEGAFGNESALRTFWDCGLRNAECGMRIADCIGVEWWSDGVMEWWAHSAFEVRRSSAFTPLPYRSEDENEDEDEDNFANH